MARFTSSKYRTLTVKFSQHGKVQFENGEVELDGAVAAQMAEFAEQHPEFEIELAEGKATPETPKQRVQREARERGLDDSGTVAEIEARIAAHDAADDQADDEADDQDDDQDDDEAADDE